MSQQAQAQLVKPQDLRLPLVAMARCVCNDISEQVQTQAPIKKCQFSEEPPADLPDFGVQKLCDHKYHVRFSGLDATDVTLVGIKNMLPDIVSIGSNH